MKKLGDLFKVIELTRSQPQYGYALSGISKNELSNLAEHHYLVTFIAWQLARHLKDKGANLDVQKILEFGLVHDLGELFGGDIAMPYAKANPIARKFAKAFEAENQIFLAKFFGKESSNFLKLGSEILNAKSDEAIIAKVADYIEVTHYKFHVKVFSHHDLKLIEPKLNKMISLSKDKVVKKELKLFVKKWIKDFSKKNIVEILY